MWFDAQAALAEIEGGALPPSDPALAKNEASLCTKPDKASPLPPTVPRVAQVAQVARHLTRNPEAAPDTETGAEPFTHGKAFDGSPRTWTGCVVSLAAWRDLTEWDRHGPNGRHWNGITKQWEKAEGDDNGHC